MGSPLIDVDRLHELTGQVTLLDIRFSLTGPPGREAYDRGHLPGAQFVDLDTELAAPPGTAGRHPLPEPQAFARAMRSHGVSSRGPVVVYDAGDGIASARGWWLLRHYGHEDVRVLDGGYAAWTAAGLPVSTAIDDVAPGDFDGSPGAMRVLDTDDVLRFAGTNLLLDARAGERFRGEVEPLDPVAGHIPGAVSAPAAENVGPDDRLLAPQELRHRFERMGASPGDVVGAYCGSGVTAAHEVLALELAGIDGALYPGSWSAWIADPTRPIQTGPAEDQADS